MSDGRIDDPNDPIGGSALHRPGASGVATGGSDPGHEDLEPMSFRQRTARIAALVGVLLILVMWGWALFGSAPDKLPGTLDDPSFATAAEEICTATAGELAQLPRSYMTPDHVQRAAVVRQSDVILSTMLDRLDAIAPADGSADADMVDEWLGDWRTYIGDRENYATALSTDQQARFYVTIKEKRQVTVPIDFFATANEMYNCVTPDDVE